MSQVPEGLMVNSPLPVIKKSVVWQREICASGKRYVARSSPPEARYDRVCTMRVCSNLLAYM